MAVISTVVNESTENLKEDLKYYKRLRDLYDPFRVYTACCPYYSYIKMIASIKKELKKRGEL